MKEKLLKLLENDIKDVVSRFGIGTEFTSTDWGFTSTPINMTPRMFKDIHIEGRYYEEELLEKDFALCVSLSYRYTDFGGGSNGVSLCSISYFVRNDYEELFDRVEGDINFLFKRRYVIMP